MRHDSTHSLRRTKAALIYRKTGNLRIDQPDDFVRIEIARALARNVRVIPVLVDGAAPLCSDDLPNDLKALARRQAMQLRHDRFGSDVETLVATLRNIMSTPGVGAKPSPQGAAHEPDVSPRGLNAGWMTLFIGGLIALSGVAWFSATAPWVSEGPSSDAAIYLVLLVAYPFVAGVGCLMIAAKAATRRPFHLYVFAFFACGITAGVVTLGVWWLANEVARLLQPQPTDEEEKWLSFFVLSLSVVVPVVSGGKVAEFVGRRFTNA